MDYNSIVSIGDKRFINVDVEGVAEVIKSAIEIGLTSKSDSFSSFIEKIVGVVVEKLNKSFALPMKV